jgi:hypothetical protein
MATGVGPAPVRIVARGTAGQSASSAGFPHTAPVQYGRLAWIAGLLLTLSPFMDWYVATQPNGLTYAVTGWHTGALGKLVFFIGLVTLILEALREAGIGIRSPVEEFILVGLGALASIFVLVRLASIPDTYFAAGSRGIGLYLALVAALGLVAAGLFRLAEPVSER